MREEFARDLDEVIEKERIGEISPNELLNALLGVCVEYKAKKGCDMSADEIGYTALAVYEKRLKEEKML